MRRSWAVRSVPRKKRTRLIPASAFFLSEAELREQKFFAPLFFEKKRAGFGAAPRRRGRGTASTPSIPQPTRHPRPHPHGASPAGTPSQFHLRGGNESRLAPRFSPKAKMLVRRFRGGDGEGEAQPLTFQLHHRHAILALAVAARAEALHRRVALELLPHRLA